MSHHPESSSEAYRSVDLRITVTYRDGSVSPAQLSDLAAGVAAFYEKYVSDPEVDRVVIEYGSLEPFVAYTRQEGILEPLWPDEFRETVRQLRASGVAVGDEISGIVPKGPGILEVPDFLHREPPNRVEDFERCRHTKDYLAHCSRTCGVDRKTLWRITGLKHLTKFDKFRAQWHALARPIRKVYLEAIGVDLDVLREVVELDRKDFAAALTLPRHPRSVMIYLFGGIYLHRPIPEDWSEEQALEWMQAHTAERGLRTLLSYPDLLTYIVWPERGLKRYEYWPRLRETKTEVDFGPSGAGIGTLSIGGRRF